MNLDHFNIDVRERDNILVLGPGRDCLFYEKYFSNDNLYRNNIRCTMVDRINININDSYTPNVKYLYGDLFEVLEDYSGPPFTQIHAYRVLEHIPYEKLQYLSYLLYKLTDNSAYPDDVRLDIVVPDFNKVAEYIKFISDPPINTQLITAHTEVYNEENDPHCSIWTPELARYYICGEGYWSPIHCCDDHDYITLDNRSWYMRMLFRRAPKTKYIFTYSGSHPTDL